VGEELENIALPVFGCYYAGKDCGPQQSKTRGKSLDGQEWPEPETGKRGYRR
jgi:hypothetical protein